MVLWYCCPLCISMRYSFILTTGALSLLLTFVAFQQSFSQEQLGMRLERYAGIYAAGINPAFSADNPNNWEISLFTAEGFFENNYAFVRNTSFPQLLKNSDQIVLAEDTPETPRESNSLLLDFFDAKRKMHGVIQTRVSGPGFSARIGENHVIGFTTAFRTQVSAYKIPPILAYNTISDLNRNEVYAIPSAGFSGMSWGEIGLHYSYRNDDADLITTWGVSPKLLLGFEGMYTRARASFDYSQQIGDTSVFGSGNWDYALTLGNAANPDDVKLRRQGMGVGFDAGISWEGTSETGSGFDWRFGVSILDAGFIRFNKNAQQHHIEFDTIVTVSNADFPSRDDVSLILQDASQAFLGDPSASLQKESFSIGLPTALSLQYDVKLAPKVIVTGVLVQRIPFSKTQLKRPNTLAVVPRFVSEWFSASLPVVLDDWQSLRMGAAVRLGWLYIGSDNLGSFFKQRQFTGSDFYVGLKVNGFYLNVGDKNKLGKESRTRRGRQQMRKIKCYQF